MSPYARRTVTDEEHRFFEQLAWIAAERSTLALANGSMRLGQAHRYLIAAHLAALMNGAGEDEALTFLERLVADLTGAPGD